MTSTVSDSVLAHAGEPARRASVLPHGALVAILRAPNAEHFLTASRVLYSAGFRCLEYTLTTDGALDAAVQAKQEFPEALVGIGSVRTSDQLRAAAVAGADFAVSQVFLPRLVETAAALDLCYVPGTLTPTEIVSAWNSGVPAVKVSPIGPLGGPTYLKEILAPMPDVAMMPTGGVTLEQVPEYLRLGAVAVGVSGALFGDGLTTGNLDGLAERATQLITSSTTAG